MKIARLVLLALLFFPFSLHALTDALPKPFAAPDLTSPGPWLNGKPLIAADLKGKVVLVDFWTYSCINCLRTLPYLRAWYEQYKDQGFVILGVHAPEFDFEKQTPNVEKAIKRFKISWPVVQDNDRAIWNRFANQYWPAHYLINREGQVVYTHFGEGKYDVTEHNIRELLGTSAPKTAVEAQPRAAYHQSLETYLGTDRAERFSDKPAPTNGIYTFPDTLNNDYWALNGKWLRERQYVEAQEANAALRLYFRGGKVFLVMGTATGQPVKARILLNGKPPESLAGKDAPDGMVTINEYRLYELIDRKSPITDNSQNLIEIQAIGPGLRAYAFTFGA